MGERKVISKYYPPDFDPSKVPKIKVKKAPFTKVTTMLPMSIRCNTCGEYIGRGTKFNAKKETVQGQDYLGIKIYRFFIRCKKCAAELTIRTDPKNSEYVCEAGATRNYEPWRESSEDKQSRLTKEQEEEQDAMKALENRTIESKREMEMMDALEDLKAMNERNNEIDHEQLLEYNLQKQEEQERLQEEEDDKLVKSIFQNKSNSNNNNNSSSSSRNLDSNFNDDSDDNQDSDEIENIDSNTMVKKIEDDKFNSLFSNNNNSNTTSTTTTTTTTTTTNQPKSSVLGNRLKVIIKKQEELDNNNNNNNNITTTQTPPPKPTPAPNSLSSLVSSYSSDEEDD